MNNKIGNIIKSIDFNTSFFIQERIIERNKEEVKIKFGNKNIFRKIANNIFVENNYRQGSIQHSFISFSGVVSETTPAIFYFICPDFLKNQKCTINILLNPAIYFSKIASQNITKTLNILSDSPESNSNQNDIYVSENYYPPQATSGQWQGEGVSNIPEPQRENTLPSTIYYYENEVEEDKGYLRHFHQYKIIGEPSSNIFSSNVYHSHYFKMKKHSHKISFFDHRHKFSPHKHKFSSYSHNHNINLNHSHNLENNIYFSNKVGSLLKILVDDNINYVNNSEIKINSGKHTIKIYVNSAISNIKCNIEIIGNYI